MFLNNCIENCLSINTLVCEYEDSLVASISVVTMEVNVIP